MDDKSVAVVGAEVGTRVGWGVLVAGSCVAVGATTVGRTSVDVAVRGMNEHAETSMATKTITMRRIRMIFPCVD